MSRADALFALARAPERCALFVDFDGTLAPIVNDPASARPLPGASAALERLGERFGVVAVVSGRPASFLIATLALAPSALVYLAGHYGMEQGLANGEIMYPEQAARWASVLDTVAARLVAALPSGIEIERKRLGVTLHWRNAPDLGAQALVHAHAAAAAEGLDVHHGKMAVEVVAPLGIDKASVVTDLASGLETACMIGDDLGDLAAFAALDALSRTSPLRSVCIAVGGAETPAALLDAADLVLDDPRDTVAFLNELVERTT